MKFVALVAALFGLSVTAAHSTVTVNLWEMAGNVEGQAIGTLDLTGLTPYGTNIGYPDDFRVQPNGAEVLFFGLGDLHRSPTVAPNFGTGSIIVEALQSEGDHFGWEFYNIVVPVGFSSGDSIFSTGRILGTTLAALGAVTGTYNWALPNDTITLIVGQAPSAVPLPAGLPLLMGGLGVLGAIGARRKHRRG